MLPERFRVFLKTFSQTKKKVEHEKSKVVQKN